LIYFAVELFGTTTINVALLPTETPANPVKLTVLFADEFAVKTTYGCAILIFKVALIAVVIFADSKVELRNVVAPETFKLPNVAVEAILSPVIVVAVIASDEIFESAIFFLLC
jgi:ABC-type Fe3+-siderophore transport system permease subunit